MCVQRRVVVTHEPTLTRSSQRLECGRVGGPLRQAQRCNATSHCTTGYHQHLVAFATQLCDLRAQRLHHRHIDGSKLVGNR